MLIIQFCFCPPYIREWDNTGIDFEIGYRRTIGDWKFDVNFNASHVHNEVIDLEGRDLTTSGIKAVSYTHLDVYKRQDNRSSVPQTPGLYTRPY